MTQGETTAKKLPNYLTNNFGFWHLLFVWKTLQVGNSKNAGSLEVKEIWGEGAVIIKGHLIIYQDQNWVGKNGPSPGPPISNGPVVTPGRRQEVAF